MGWVGKNWGVKNRSEGERKKYKGRERIKHERFKYYIVGLSRQHLKLAIVRVQLFQITNKLGAQSLHMKYQLVWVPHLVLVLATATYLAKATVLEKTPTISLYFHDTPEKCNSNVKVIPVAHIAGMAWNVPKSDTVIVTEYPITITPG